MKTYIKYKLSLLLAIIAMVVSSNTTYSQQFYEVTQSKSITTLPPAVDYCRCNPFGDIDPYSSDFDGSKFAEDGVPLGDDPSCSSNCDGWLGNIIAAVKRIYDRKDDTNNLIRDTHDSFEKEVERMFDKQFDNFAQASDLLFDRFTNDAEAANINDGLGKSFGRIDKLAQSIDTEGENLIVLDQRGFEIQNGLTGPSLTGDYKIDGLRVDALKTIPQIEQARREALQRMNSMLNQINHNGRSNLYEGSQKLRTSSDARRQHYEGIASDYKRIQRNKHWREKPIEKSLEYIRAVIIIHKIFDFGNDRDCNRPGNQNLPECVEKRQYEEELKQQMGFERLDYEERAESSAFQQGKNFPPYQPRTRTLQEILDSLEVPENFSPEVKELLASLPDLNERVKHIIKERGQSSRPVTFIDQLLTQYLQSQNGTRPQARNGQGYFRNDGNPNGVVSDWAKSVFGVESPGDNNPLNRRSVTLPNLVTNKRILLPPATRYDLRGLTDILAELPDNLFTGRTMQEIMFAQGILNERNIHSLPGETMAKYFEFRRGKCSTLVLGSGTEVCDPIDITTINFKNNLGEIFWKQGLQDYDSVFDHINRVEGLGSQLELNFGKLQVLLRAPDFTELLRRFLNDNQRDIKAESFARNAIDNFSEGEEIKFECYKSSTGNADDCNKRWFLDNDNDDFFAEIRLAETSPGIRWKLNLKVGNVDCDDDDPKRTTVCEADSDPCAELEKLLARSDYKAKFNEINKRENFTKLEETGFDETLNSEGNVVFTDLEVGENTRGNTLDVDITELTKGATHTHINPYKNSTSGEPMQPIRMPSPRDVFSLLQILFNSAKVDARINAQEAYVAMLSSTGNYMLKFLPERNLNREEIMQISKISGNLNDLKSTYENFMGNFGSLSVKQELLEKRFLRFIDEKMNLGGIIGLYKINDDQTIEQKFLVPDPDKPTKKRKQKLSSTNC